MNARKPALLVARALLVAQLGNVPVLTDIDIQRPNRFVRITRVGGPRLTKVTDGPMILAECWDVRSAEALAGEVADIFELAPGRYVNYTGDDGKPAHAWISSWHEVGGPVRHPDPDVLSQDRWTLTVRLGISTNV
ncbi:hypothetical protein D5S18_02990 [Nocardia panacis]|uniref:Uncharacterized protein n=1 Tax=Nocardia panacis TaxID=2340916 RepID=A0A3A4KPC1_9NOCA|nr:hypothetical protein [Nocardia panacis]RJO79312.1 hypothetical protein D5S18_02990 [Nocardia panacis]